MLSEILFHMLFALAMYALARISPAPPARREPRFDVKDLQRLNRKGSFLALLGLFIWTPVCTLVLASLFFELQGIYDQLWVDTPYKIVATFPHWCVVGAIFALAACRAPVEYFMLYFSDQDTLDAVNYVSSHQYHYDPEIGWKFLTRFLSIVGFVAFVMVSDFGIYVYPDRVLYNPLLSLFSQQRMPLSGVYQIAHADKRLNPNGTTVSEPIFYLRFENGTIWKSNFNDYEKVEPVVLHLSRITGIGMDSVAVWR